MAPQTRAQTVGASALPDSSNIMSELWVQMRISEQCDPSFLLSVWTSAFVHSLSSPSTAARPWDVTPLMLYKCNSSHDGRRVYGNWGTRALSKEWLRKTMCECVMLSFLWSAEGLFIISKSSQQIDSAGIRSAGFYAQARQKLSPL